ncbi:hypothetical protein BDV93DRAFT_505037 [Ceratobasidium sp. AG-I]|nr:hypothetical protein BDV93DRAFT_505037 [Ceratobasidium sp. AG-I]
MLRMSTNASVRRTFALLAPRALPRMAGPALTRPALMYAMRGMADQPPKPKAKDIATDPSGVFNSARKELKDAAGSVAGIISGNVSRDQPSIDRSDVAAVTRELGGSSKTAHGGLKEDFVSITKDIAETVPNPVLRMGLAGGLPYIGTSFASLYYARQAGQAFEGMTTIDSDTAMQTLYQVMHVQVTYGAVLLGFLGAMHWGLEFAKYGGEKGYKRLALGVAPALYAWPTLALAPEVALATQWAGFTALWYADSKATSAGWTPKWHSQYRFYLSILVGGCIIGTLAGVNYFGPESHPPRVYNKHSPLTGGSMKQQGTLSGDTEGIEAVPGAEDSDAYVIIKKMDKPEEGGDDAESKEGDKGARNTSDSGTKEAQQKKEQGQREGKGGEVKQAETSKKSGDLKQGDGAKGEK